MDVVVPPPVNPGDTVRFVSPASTPERDNVHQRAEILERWGLKVQFADHAFGSYGYMAATDEQRLADLNDAYRDPEVRAVIATRGGSGSYRIAADVDFAAVRANPKMLLGFSDITALHSMLWRQCRIVGVHGKLMGDFADRIDPLNSEAYRAALMGHGDLVVPMEPTEITAELTTKGRAEGVLLGGHLKLLAAMAGWGLPSFDGAILMLEAVNMSVEDADRALLMLTKGGHLDGVAGVAVCQFTGFRSHGEITIMSLLRDYLGPLGVPILGGVPLGHGAVPRSVYLGTFAVLDADNGTLISTRKAAP
jgi:muramoyltetrapeptide carboxypeptidase